jgi:hypothetical protein
MCNVFYIIDVYLAMILSTWCMGYTFQLLQLPSYAYNIGVIIAQMLRNSLMPQLL